MPTDDEASLGDQQTFAGGALPSDPAERSLGDQSTFGGDDGSSISDLDGPATDADFDMEVIDLSARYTIERVLGQGGMGQVLLATDTRLNRKVAIKRMREDAVRSRTAVSRFLTEAKSIAALSNHPNIVDIYDFGRDEAGPFLIMEYVDGGCLLDRCRAGALPLDEAVHITCQLCSALEMAHEAGIIHRDIKPANVLLTKDGVPALTDFGLARQDSVNDGMTVTGAVLGTVDFMPPEQRKDAALTDARSDLWSLAATLYQMVTGRSPKIIRFNNIPQALQDVLGKALEDRQDDRYQTAREFRKALQASLTASDAAVAAAADLGAGECLKCHTANDAERKFCRSCAASLRVHCLSCSEVIPVWDSVCGECGAKQEDLLEQQRSVMSQQQAEAESLLKHFDFDGAAAVATALRDEPDVRLQHLAGWSSQFLKEITAAYQQQQERNVELLQEALQHEQAFDYPSALHALELIPEKMRDDDASGRSERVTRVLSRVQQNQDECERLDRLIRQLIDSRQLNGLLKEVDSLLLLRPDRADLLKLKGQLEARETKHLDARDAAIESAQTAMGNHDYDAAINALDQINAHVTQSRRTEIERLRHEAAAKRDRQKALRSEIDDAVRNKKFDGLLEKVGECLAISPDDPSFTRLRERLRAREEKLVARIPRFIDEAKMHGNASRFQDAMTCLDRIPISLQTDDSKLLRKTFEKLDSMREQAMAGLASAAGDRTVAQFTRKAEKDVDRYCEALEKGEMQDQQFQNRLIEVRHLLKSRDVTFKAREGRERRRHMYSTIVRHLIAWLAMPVSILIAVYYVDTLSVSGILIVIFGTFTSHACYPKFETGPSWGFGCLTMLAFTVLFLAWSSQPELRHRQEADGRGLVWVFYVLGAIGSASFIFHFNANRNNKSNR